MNQTITYLRNVAILAIVLHHCMCAFCGWPPNHEIGGDIPSIANTFSGMAKNLGLGVFTFISGYVLYYQTKKNETYTHLFTKKVKRILLPCLFWGCVYVAFFSSYMYSNWPSGINGTHLWYLPMLFLCLMITGATFYVKRPWTLLGFCLLVMFVLAKFTHFRTFSEFCSYYPVFLGGFLMNKFQVDSLIKRHKCLSLIIAGGGNIVAFNVR